MKTLLYVLVLLISIILHEMGHALAALLLGDDTAKKQKRFYVHTHFDFWGSLVLPLILFLFHSPFLIGYSKPVPVDIRKFKDPLLDFALVGLAGPTVNFLLAFIAYIFLHNFSLDSGLIVDALGMFIVTNLGLGFFNLIPIPPLDGSRIMFCLLPFNMAIRYEKLEYLGIFLIFVLEFLSIELSKFLNVDCDLFSIFVKLPTKYILQLMFG